MIQKHKSDPDLFHPIGEDPYCQFCEQYNELSKKATIIRNNIEAYEREHPVDAPLISKVTAPSPSKPPFSVYDVQFNTGEHFLVYSDSAESCCTFLNKTTSSLLRSNRISKDYFDSFYLEDEQGSVIPLRTAVKGLRRKNKLIAEKAQTKLRTRGLCFNEAPFEFFKYSADNLNRLKAFCGEDCPISKTKKFTNSGRISVQDKRGMFAIENGQVLLKIGKDILIPLSKEEFEQNFSEDESLTWIKK